MDNNTHNNTHIKPGGQSYLYSRPIAWQPITDHQAGEHVFSQFFAHAAA
jgi:hypothetical protein